VGGGGGRGAELISPDEVAAALRQFVDDFRRLKGLDQQPDDPDIDGDRRDHKFWARLVDTHPEEHYGLWGVLGESLKSYGEILKERAVALDDCDTLQAQNQELKFLLHQYMSADINKELVIPPTVVMAHQVRQNAA
jgi:dynein regulatory complex protein 1